jgi:hypothetical protein
MYHLHVSAADDLRGGEVHVPHEVLVAWVGPQSVKSRLGFEGKP